MKKKLLALLFLVPGLYGFSQTRMIAMSDIGGSDPDDTQSLVHLLVSLDQVELEGFISQHAWVPYGKGAMSLIHKIIDGYETVLPNLLVHHKNFPSAEYLRSVVKQGQTEAAMHGVGEGKDSEGSEWIIATVDKKDPRPVWITAWSGLSTLAQALWKVSQTRTKEQVDEFVRKIRVYDVLGQDDARSVDYKELSRTYLYPQQTGLWLAAFRRVDQDTCTDSRSVGSALSRQNMGN